MTALAVLFYLWVGWLSVGHPPNATATYPAIRAGRTNAPAQWVGIETANGGLVQAGVFAFAGGTDQAFAAFCQRTTLCTPQHVWPVTPGDRVTIGVNWLGGNRWRMSVWDRTAGWARWVHGRYPGRPAHDVWVTETQSSVPWRGVAMFSRPTAVPVAPIANPLSGLRPAGRFQVVGQ